MRKVSWLFKTPCVLALFVEIPDWFWAVSAWRESRGWDEAKVSSETSTTGVKHGSCPDMVGERKVKGQMKETESRQWSQTPMQWCVLLWRITEVFWRLLSTVLTVRDFYCSPWLTILEFAHIAHGMWHLQSLKVLNGSECLWITTASLEDNFLADTSSLICY